VPPKLTKPSKKKLYKSSRSRMGSHGMDLSGLGYAQVASSCECSNEPSSCI